MVEAQRGSPHRPAKVLVVGRPEKWPALLIELVEHRAIELQCVAGIHEAAARLTLRRGEILGVLVDPHGLSRHEWEMLAVLKRHTPQPVWSLPNHAGREQTVGQGVIPWETAARELGRLLKASTPQDKQGSKGIIEPEQIAAKTYLHTCTPLPKGTQDGPAAALNPPDNGPAAAPKKDAEMPMVPEVADGYDKASSDPLVSENEIRALLGP